MPFVDLGMASIPRPGDDEEQQHSSPVGAEDSQVDSEGSSEHAEKSNNPNENTSTSSSAPDEDIPDSASQEDPSVQGGRSLGDIGRNLLDGLKGGVGKIMAPAAGVFMSASTALAGTIGVSSKVATALTGLALAATIGAGGAGLYAVANPEINPALFVGAPDCTERVKEAVRAAEGSVDDENAEREKNAILIWSALSSFCGMDDIHIAGVLSNFTAESGVDPTTIETIYDEPYHMGPRKTAAAADFNAFEGPCKAAYAKGSAVSVNWSAYMVDGEFWPGIGLAQWTGGGAKRFAETSETTVDGEWWRMDYSVAYMIATGSACGGGGGVDFFNTSKSGTYASTSYATPEEASRAFSLGYEHGAMPENLIQGHMETANEWYSKMSSWTVDSQFVSSVSAMAQNMGAQANTKKANDERKECSPCKNSLGDYDNSSLAAAAASYAYPTEAQGVGNNGTDLYVAVHDAVYPGDGYYMSCDRSVACAVKWSGADDDYPPGSTTETEAHMQSSPLWEEVTDQITTNQSDGSEGGGEFGLLPGDVLNTVGNGHIVIYVGTEAIEEIHGEAAESGSNVVSGSFGTRSPGCGVYKVTQAGGGTIHINSDSRPYKVYRRVAEDVEPYTETYKDVAELADVSISTGSSSSSKKCNSSKMNMNNANSTTLNGDAYLSGVNADSGAAVYTPTTNDGTDYVTASGKTVKDTSRYLKVDSSAIVSEEDWKAGDDNFKKSHFYYGEEITLQRGDVRVKATVEDSGTLTGDAAGTKKLFEMTPILKADLANKYDEGGSWDDGVRINWYYPADYYKNYSKQ